MDSEPETGDGLGGAFAVNPFEVADFALGNVVVAKPANFVVDGMYRGTRFRSRRRTPRLALRELGSRPNQQDGIRRIGAVDFLHAG